ncbi:MAG TPA: hypothetical protein VH814_21825 [Steroidobacteraceae bacterium]|jgi:type IV secretory pathway VirB10-like protein
MSARVFFAGAAVGVIVGALAVVALQTARAPKPLAENAPTATVRKETTSRSNVAPPKTPVDDVQSPADLSVPVPPAPGSTADVAPASSSDPGDEVFRTHTEAQARGESIEQLRDKMKSEARDEAWASGMERDLGDYLARRPVPNALGSTSVECRATVCRILSVVDDQVFAAVPMSDLQAAVAGLPDDSLGGDVVSAGLVMTGDPKHPGQMIEAAFLRRADKPSNSSRR